MKSPLTYLPAALLLGACGSMQDTAMVRDDVYDIPDRNVTASVAPMPEEKAPEPAGDDYYNAEEASRYEQGSYWDRTYNDPDWYNRGRFGFGYNVSPWGSGLSMSYGYGWGNNTWFNGPGGMYNPYWGNSWTSGYGAWGNSYGYYDPWNQGYYNPWMWNGYYSPYGWGTNWNGYYNGYGGFCGWNPYCGGGGSYGNPYVEGTGNSVVVGHRPGMSSEPGIGGLTRRPRSARPLTLMPEPDRTRPTITRNGDDGRYGKEPIYHRGDRPAPVERPARERDRVTPREPATTPAERPTRERERERVTPRPQRERSPEPRTNPGDGGGGRGGRDSSPSHSPSPAPSPSPRPRR